MKTQPEFIHDFNDAYREQFNDELFSRETDEIIEEVKKVILSYQRSRSFLIRVDKFTVVEDYAEIQRMLYEQEKIRSRSKDRKNKNKKDAELPHFISLRDTDVKLLVVDYTLAVYNEPIPEKASKKVRVLIEIPRIVDKYYFYIYGNKYYATYQILESTYNNTASNSKTDTVTLKTMFMASRIYRYNIQTSKEINLVNTRGEKMTGIYYHSRIFDKPVQAMRYLLAHYGLYEFMRRIKVPYLTITDYDPDDDELYTVNKHDLFVNIPKKIYDNDLCAQSLFYTVVCCIYKDTTLNDMFTIEHWLECLGESYGTRTVEKGLSLLESLEGIYDNSTKEHLKLPEDEKENIYDVMLWVLREYSALRTKSNLDITMKRVRWAEYIAVLYGMKILRRILNNSGRGSKITLAQLERSVVTFPDNLIRLIVKDRLINYADNVNDLDCLLALKYSYKGVSGLGEQGASIPDEYRQLHPSHIGRIDLDAATATDPGLSGMLCPMADIHNGQFSQEGEPDTWREECDQFLLEYRRVVGLKEAMKFKQAVGVDTTDELIEIEDTLNCAKNLLDSVAAVDSDITVTEELRKAFEYIGESKLGEQTVK